MDRLNPFAIPLLPVTKTWVFGIVALAVATSMDMVSITKLIFFPSRVFTEPWRLITGFCFFGPLHFTLLQYLFIIARTNNTLESDYIFRIEHMPQDWICSLDKESKRKLREITELHETRDFAYFVAEIALSIVATILILSRWYDVAGSFFLLGPALEKILLYVLCRNTPDEYIQIMGISIKAKYAPFLTHFLEFLFSDEYKAFAKVFPRDSSLAFKTIATSSLVKQTLLVYCTGHAWWFIQYFYLSDVYNGFSTSNSEEWSKSFKNFRNPRPVFFNLPGFWRRVVTPPWYYFTINALLKEQANARSIPAAAIIEENDIEGHESVDEGTEIVDSAEGSTGINPNESVSDSPSE